MKTKLSYKIFGAFFITSVTIVSLTLGTLHFFGQRIFYEFVNKMEMEKLSDLVEMLTAEYQVVGDWHRIQKSPLRWVRMVRFAGRRQPPREGEPPDLLPEYRLPDDKMDMIDLHPPIPPPPPFRMHSKIFLLDADKNLIAGLPDGDLTHCDLQEIVLNGQTLGWLGIRRGEKAFGPLENTFLQKQNELFVLIALGIFMISAFVSFFLSRHLLAPIKELTEGTRALASRRFGTRIEVRSRDELGQLAQDFNMMAQTLERYENMRKQWISDISHELRTPLSILRGEIEALQDRVRNFDAQALDSLNAEVLHMGKIVNDLHELSMADAGALSIDRKPLNPTKVLRETLNIFQTKFETSQISIVDELHDFPQISMLGDSDRLGQLFANLLENTLRYADSPGSLRIRQSVSSKDVTYYFEDSGPGVPDESLSRLFDRLYRVDSARTRNKGGSGLGLAICKTIAEVHGGGISAANAASGGLQIKVVLPIALSRGGVFSSQK